MMEEYHDLNKQNAQEETVHDKTNDAQLRSSRKIQHVDRSKVDLTMSPTNTISMKAVQNSPSSSNSNLESFTVSVVTSPPAVEADSDASAALNFKKSLPISHEKQLSYDSSTSISKSHQRKTSLGLVPLVSPKSKSKVSMSEKPHLKRRHTSGDFEEDFSANDIDDYNLNKCDLGTTIYLHPVVQNPPRKYWNILIFYTLIIMVLKYMFQLPVVCPQQNITGYISLYPNCPNTTYLADSNNLCGDAFSPTFQSCRPSYLKYMKKIDSKNNTMDYYFAGTDDYSPSFLSLCKGDLVILAIIMLHVWILRVNGFWKWPRRHRDFSSLYKAELAEVYFLTIHIFKSTIFRVK
jgi:hypothetical protein